jgi:hypothetical protein
VVDELLSGFASSPAGQSAIAGGAAGRKYIVG